MTSHMGSQVGSHMGLPSGTPTYVRDGTNGEETCEGGNLSGRNARTSLADVITLRGARRVGQHDWRRALRGQMNSPTTFAVAQAVASYTNKDGSNAHPGNERLAADVNCTTKTIQRALKWLREEGWLQLDQTASPVGHSRKLAQVWSLTVPERWTSKAALEDTGVHPPDPDLHQSASVKRAHFPSGPKKDHRLDVNHEGFDPDYAEEWIADQVDGFYGFEMSTTGNMLANGVHPQVIARKILAERAR